MADKYTGKGRKAADTGWGKLNSLGEPVRIKLKPRTRYTWTVRVVTNEPGEEAVSEDVIDADTVSEDAVSEDTVSEDIYRSRLEICMTCDKLIGGMTCRECGCFVQFRARHKSAACIYGKWPKITSKGK